MRKAALRARLKFRGGDAIRQYRLFPAFTREPGNGQRGLFPGNRHLGHDRAAQPEICRLGGAASGTGLPVPGNWHCMLENVPDQSSLVSSRPYFGMWIFSGCRWRCWARRGAGLASGVLFLASLTCIGILSGCSGLRPKPAATYVYVTAKQTFLRDRVAAVSNRPGTVENGQKLEVLEHGRRFFRVKTLKGEVGLIDEKAVSAQDIFAAFQALGETHKSDPAVASAVVRDEVNLHLKPGRDTERFYRLAEGEKMQLLDRATLPKPVPGGAAPTKIDRKSVG